VTLPPQDLRQDFPAWFAPLLDVVDNAERHQLSIFSPPVDRSARRSAVLILFGQGDAGPDVLLTERAADLRSHAGQVAFPGGALDPGDGGPVGAALREAQEETGLDPSGVQVAGPLPDLFLMVSDFVVTPVVAWWREPSPVGPVNTREVAKVVRVPVAELVDPAHRFRVVHPSGYVGPGFSASGLFVWGFTAGLLDRLFHLTGWDRPWDLTRSEPLPPSMLRRGPSPGSGTVSATGPLPSAQTSPTSAQTSPTSAQTSPTSVQTSPTSAQTSPTPQPGPYPSREIPR
jgi:8-oxo-dGTP pyrophosphatase MutT (NUDIX family)